MKQMKRFKEVFEASVEKLDDINVIKQKMAEVISNYAPLSYTTFSAPTPKVLNYFFTGENARAELNLIRKVLSAKYPEINFAVRPFNDSYIVTVFA